MTKLARRRVERNLTQPELARLTGIGLRTLRTLERGETRNPKLGYLVNCSIVLKCDLADLLEDAWLEWHELHPNAPRRPQRRDGK